MDTLDKILFLIKENNIEQQELALYIGARKQVISEWKKGKTKSYMKYIDKIAEFFGVSTDYLLGTDAPSNSQNNELMELLNNLDKNDIQKVRSYIDFLISQKT